MRRILPYVVLFAFGCSEYEPRPHGTGGANSMAQGGAIGTQTSQAGSSIRTEAGGGMPGDTSRTLQALAGGGAGRTSSLGDPGGVAGSTSGGAYAAGGSSSVAGEASTGGTDAAAGGATAGTSTTADFDCGIPAAGSAGVQRPNGATGGFKIIDWAGFNGAVSFTFDDGNGSQLDHYATLESLGVKYTFFLIGSNAASNQSAWQQVFADGHELGNHTQYHLAGDPAGSDVAAGQRSLESTYGIKTYTMAAPYGDDYTSIAPNYHFLNRGVSNGLMTPNDDSAAFRTPCFIPDAGAKVAAFDGEVQAARDGNGWKVILVHGFTGDGSAYNPVDIEEFSQAVQNAKSHGDLWIDTFAKVGAYWRGQAAVSKAQVTSSGSDQTWSWALPEHFPPGRCLRVTVTGGTLKQNGNLLPWNDHGYYEISLDAGSVTLSP